MYANFLHILKKIFLFFLLDRFAGINSWQRGLVKPNQCVRDSGPISSQDSFILILVHAHCLPPSSPHLSLYLNCYQDILQSVHCSICIESRGGRLIVHFFRLGEEPKSHVLQTCAGYNIFKKAVGKLSWQNFVEILPMLCVFNYWAEYCNSVPQVNIPWGIFCLGQYWILTGILVGNAEEHVNRRRRRKSGSFFLCLF